MTRLFLALDLDERTRTAVTEIVARLSRRLRNDPHTRRITWVQAEHLHLTLRFLGNADETQVRSLQSAFAMPLNTAAIDLSFEGLGIFLAVGPARVLWLGVTGDRAELWRLHREIEGRLRDVGYPPDSRPFQAHLTLGRIRDAAGRPSLDAVEAEKAFAGPCRVDRVTLYESRLSSAGPTHTAIARAVMNARP